MIKSNYFKNGGKTNGGIISNMLTGFSNWANNTLEPTITTFVKGNDTNAFNENEFQRLVHQGQGGNEVASLNEFRQAFPNREHYNYAIKRRKTLIDQRLANKKKGNRVIRNDFDTAIENSLKSRNNTTLADVRNARQIQQNTPQLSKQQQVKRIADDYVGEKGRLRADLNALVGNAPKEYIQNENAFKRALYPVASGIPTILNPTNRLSIMERFDRAVHDPVINFILLKSLVPKAFTRQAAINLTKPQNVRQIFNKMTPWQKAMALENSVELGIDVGTGNFGTDFLSDALSFTTPLYQGMARHMHPFQLYKYLGIPSQWQDGIGKGISGYNYFFNKENKENK